MLLSTELQEQNMVCPAGLEPAAYSFGSCCSRPSELRAHEVSSEGFEPPAPSFVVKCSGPG